MSETSETRPLTNVELLRAAILDTRAAYAAYESMSTEELRHVQMQQHVDQAAATTPEGLAFSGGRLALIAAVLQKRGAEAR